MVVWNRFSLAGLMPQQPLGQGSPETWMCQQRRAPYPPFPLGSYIYFLPDLLSPVCVESITLLEIVRWVSFPMLVTGLWFSLRYRLRMISPIAIFTVMLSLAYSVFQGNVGNHGLPPTFSASGFLLYLHRCRLRASDSKARRKSDLAAKQAAADARDSRIAVIRESGT